MTAKINVVNQSGARYPSATQRQIADSFICDFNCKWSFFNNNNNNINNNNVCHSYAFESLGKWFTWFNALYNELAKIVFLKVSFFVLSK